MSEPSAMFIGSFTEYYYPVHSFHVVATTATGSLYFSSMLVIRFGREVKKIVIRGFVISYEIISFNYSVQRLVYNEYVLVPLSQASSR